MNLEFEHTNESLLNAAIDILKGLQEEINALEKVSVSTMNADGKGKLVIEVYSKDGSDGEVTFVTGDKLNVTI